MRFRKLLLALLFLSLGTLLLGASISEWAELAVQASAYLETRPDDDEARSNLALFYMMSNQPLLGLRQYRILIQKDELNLDAQAGAIWALNNLKQYDLSISTSRDLLRKYPDHAPFHNLIGYALLKIDNYSSARYHYHRALLLEPDVPSLNQVSHEGLAWAYMKSDDYPKALNSFLDAQALATESLAGFGFSELQETYFHTSIGYGIPNQDLESFSIEQSYRSKTNRLRFSFEELRSERKHSRSHLALQARKQLYGFSTNVRLDYVNGANSEIWPAWKADVSLSPRFYLLRSIVDTNVGFAKVWNNSYPVNLVNAGLHFTYNQIGLSCVSTFRGDDVVLQTGCTIPVYQHQVGFSYTYGDNAWIANNFGYLYDPAIKQKQSLEGAIKLALSDMLYIYQVNSYRYLNTDWEYSFFIRLGVEY